MWTKHRLILFTRYPVAGKTKTRLIPELGREGAALLHKKLVERIVSEARVLKRRLTIPTIVHYTGGSNKEMSSWLGSMTFVEQTGGDLGLKMRTAFEHTFDCGAKGAILIGTDIPDITSDLLQQAFTAMGSGKVVIGPSRDGGYYLIGLMADQASQLLPLLFENMTWSTDDLFAATARRVEKSGYTVTSLPILRDIDLPEDLPFARRRGLL